MAQCPSCSKDVEVDFGIVICPHCQTAMMFDIDGNPKLNEEVTAHENVQELVIKETGQILSAEPIFEEAPAEELPPPENIETLFEPQEDQNQIEEVVVEEAVAEEAEVEAEAEAEEEVTKDVVIEGEVRFDDVIEFGNQELSGEALLYDVMIEEVDLSEIRKQLKDVLSDSKLNLGFDIEKKIKSGVLKIEGINAIKASVIIHNCQGLPVKVSWRQYAVTNT